MKEKLLPVKPSDYPSRGLLKEQDSVVEEHLATDVKEAFIAEQKIGNLEAANELLRQQGREDKLTGLLNRRGLEEEVLKRQMEQEEQAVIVFLDIDNYKSFNSKYGEAGGDAALIAVAQALKDIFRKAGGGREPDLIARWGGEEFVVYLPQVQADKVLQSLMGKDRVARILIPFTVKVKSNKGQEKEMNEKITFSGGISEFRPKQLENLIEDLSDKINETSKVMKLAKALRKNRIILNPQLAKLKYLP